jgi:hypothetical protein
MDLRPPSGVLLPHGLLPPLDHLEPLPKLTVYPSRVTTPILTLEHEYGQPWEDATATLLSKVRAEDERMRRLLPAAPRGMHWEAELQALDPSYVYDRFRGEFVVRLVYRLKEI